MSNQDEQHLKLLSIFHYVVGGITALFSCFPIFHLIFGLTFLTGGFDIPADEGPPVMLFGLLFTIIPALIILTGWALAILIIVAGYFLSTRKHHTFCLVVAGLECIIMPFGTVLGVFSIIVLVRPSVKTLFEAISPAETSV